MSLCWRYKDSGDQEWTFHRRNRVYLLTSQKPGVRHQSIVLPLELGRAFDVAVSELMLPTAKGSDVQETT